MTTTHRQRVLSVIGLGYVGLPVAIAFARGGWRVIGFDADRERIAELLAGRDRTGEVDVAELSLSGLTFSDSAPDLAAADFHIVCVPTPINADRTPDLEPLLSASRAVGRHLSGGDVVVYESTVYPGATEEACVPVLEAESGLRMGADFTVGYSPERINPGDRAHRFENIVKVVSASDPETLELIAAVYGSVVTAGVHRAPSIKVAEAAKVIENTQRDLNIALVNELAMLFKRMGLDTEDVLAAARTKWNFLPFTPGLVGGHCIGVDPYYLTHRADQLGFHPHVILAGRSTNDGIGHEVARVALDWLGREGSEPFTVTVLGVTFKEDVPDIRNTRVGDIVADLRGAGATVQAHDPLVPVPTARAELGLELSELSDLRPADAVVLAVPHRAFRDAGWPLVEGLLKDGRGLVMDIKSALDRDTAPSGVTLWRL